MLAWLSVWCEMQTCIRPCWCHYHSLSLASVKSRLVLPFWYWLARVVPDREPLNGCVCVCVLFCSIVMPAVVQNSAGLTLALPAWYAEQDLCIGQASVRLFVCPIVCPLHSIAAFAALGPAGRRYQWIAAWPVLSSKCDQCRVDSWCRKLNTRLVDVQTVLPAWCFDSVYQIREKWLWMLYWHG